MEPQMGKLIVARHGESEWNKANLFTGKTDVHLSTNGFKASEELGALIKDIEIHKVFASTQARTIETEVCMMSGGKQCCSENIHYSSALNERDYGDYTGKNKLEKEHELGKEESDTLRRAWNYPIPNGETLKMVYERSVPFFLQEILPVLRNSENVLIVSHGNTVRSLLKYIEKISDIDIEKVEMPFNEIFIYDLDHDGHFINKEIRKIGDKVKPVQESRVRSLTQIVATIGPASSEYVVLNEMVKAGMDMARLNFFWPEPEEIKKRIGLIKKTAKENNTNIKILVDLPGPRLQDKDGHIYDINASKAITAKDKELIKFAIENDVDYLSVSFVGNKQDILDCREEIKKWNGRQKIIAKIERAVAIENIDEIIANADAIMIARGDLGNEIPIEKIPFAQDDIIKKCKQVGKPVITATQMLYSMKDNPSPTRAEATDVVNAVMEGSDAVMLSEETSIGKYPIRAVYVMEHLALEAELHLKNPKFNTF
ncbi:MAG: histidine phosphatase family protein [Patescibacteria group bacterium]|nr:histidine phosphatase family protein [Patescibacteria group bacterium]